MRRTVLVALLAVAFVVGPSAGSSELPQLVGTVGPGFTIDLADANGKHVDVVTAGRYVLLARDLSDMHNFVLGSKSTGERFVDTGVEFVGEKTVTIELTPGQYAYACSPHFETMNGRLTVIPAATATPKALSATVTKGRVTLSATRLSGGVYRLTVSDRSRFANFHLVGPSVNRRTGKAFVGRVTWTLRLGAGTYRFGSDPKLSGRLVVT